MKNFLPLLLLAALSVSLPACRDEEDDSPAEHLEEAIENATDAAENMGENLEDMVDPNEGPMEQMGENMDEMAEDIRDNHREMVEDTQ